jgi:hypothetical protein
MTEFFGGEDMSSVVDLTACNIIGNVLIMGVHGQR